MLFLSFLRDIGSPNCRVPSCFGYPWLELCLLLAGKYHRQYTHLHSGRKHPASWAGWNDHHTGQGQPAHADCGTGKCLKRQYRTALQRELPCTRGMPAALAAWCALSQEHCSGQQLNFLLADPGRHLTTVCGTAALVSTLELHCTYSFAVLTYCRGRVSKS